MPHADGVSIVVPTCGRVGLVASLLGSIAADASAVAFPVEVILVDSSGFADRDPLAQVAAAYNAVVVSAPDADAGAARNIGASRANLEYLLFVDSDVTLVAGTIQAHYNQLRSGADACAGMVVFTGGATYAWRCVEVMQVMLPFRYPLIAATVPWAPTANISFQKTNFDAIGGFDAALPPYGGEDVDLGFRFTDAGYRIRTSTHAVVEHTIETWAKWSQNISRLSSYGKADFYLIQRHLARTYLDVPSPLFTWLVQAVLAIAARSVAAFLAAFAAQFICYALLKRSKGTSVWIHLPGVFIIALLDFGKWVEAVKNRRLKPVFLRLRYLDDIIEQDWREIWAYTWAVYVSTIVFIFVLLIEALARHASSR